MSVMDKLKGLFGSAKDKAGDLAEKAGPAAAKGVDAAATGMDKMTGGRFHDQIESVTEKVESRLDKGSDRG